MKVRSSVLETGVSPSDSRRLVAVFVRAARTRLSGTTAFWASCAAAPAPLLRFAAGGGARPPGARSGRRARAAEAGPGGPRQPVPGAPLERPGALLGPP